MSYSCSEDDTKTQSDALSIFCREVRNLLRSKPNCMIPFSKFVPAYHNHYGRQCCVYQFGYTKLIELLEAIPHVVQIIGEGNNRYITLTHREQIKRFASDLIKVVKSQPGKKLKLSRFARAYEQLTGRVFRIEDYGTNDINNLLAEIWEGTINIMPIKRQLADPSIKGPLFVDTISSTTWSREPSSESVALKPYITEDHPDAWFEIPRRERSEKEVKRTKYFVRDVIELLSSLGPDYSVTFSKFIPSYHYYFNRQCKVSIFGFSKLIDLFESISPDVVEIIDQGPGEEKIIKLADSLVPTPSGECLDEVVGGFVSGNEDEESEVEVDLRREYCDVDVENDIEDEDDDDDLDVDVEEVELEEEEEEEDEEEEYEDDDEEDNGDDVIIPLQAIDNGPTQEELKELEDEIEAYEQLKAIQSKRSSRMAAILDIYRYSVY